MSDEPTYDELSRPNERVIYLNDDEAHLLLESLAGLMARSGVVDEVRATFHLAQRIEGFEVDGRPGAKRLPRMDEIPMRHEAGETA